MPGSQTTIISNLLNTVDGVGADMVSKTYQGLVSHYSPIIYSLTSVYIAISFIKAMRGQLQFNDLIFILLRTVFILTLAMKYDYFCKLIYDIFTNLPLNICKAITIHGGTTSLTSVSTALDQFLDKGITLSKELIGMGGWNNFTYLVFGLMLYLFVGFSTAFAVGLIVLAKCGTIVLLSLSPLFIFAGLFDSTKGLFDSFIKHLITYALIPIVTCAVLMILLSVSDIAIQAYSTTDPSLTNITPLCIASIIQIYMLLQVRAKCAGLSGGFNLPSVAATFSNFGRQMSSPISSMSRSLHGNSTSVANRISEMRPKETTESVLQQRLANSGYSTSARINPPKINSN